jgi:hypothetical protein
MNAPVTRSARRMGLAVLAHHKCTLIGWMTGWAAFTYGSATLRWLQTGGTVTELGRAAGAIFTVADHVPPYAKISFGALFLLLLFALPRLIASKPALGVAAAGIAALAVLCLAPFDYFAGGWGSFALNQGIASTLPHILAGLGTGLVWAVVRARCELEAEANP